jgi:hypothetical protein
VDADTPRYAAASPTENSGLGKNSMGLLMVVCDFDMGPTPSATAVCILATPLRDLRRLLNCDTSQPQCASARWHISAYTTHTAVVASAMVVGRGGYAGDTASTPEQGRPE